MAEGRQMNIQTPYELPTRPADVLHRGAEMASRAAGLAAFGICLITLLYMVAF